MFSLNYLINVSGVVDVPDGEVEVSDVEREIGHFPGEKLHLKRARRKHLSKENDLLKPKYSAISKTIYLLINSRCSIL